MDLWCMSVATWLLGLSNKDLLHILMMLLYFFKLKTLLNLKNIYQEKCALDVKAIIFFSGMPSVKLEFNTLS